MILDIAKAPVFDLPEIPLIAQLGLPVMIAAGFALMVAVFINRSPAVVSVGAFILGVALVAATVGLAFVVDGDQKDGHAKAIVAWADDEYGIELTPEVTRDLLSGENISVEYRGDTVSIRAEKTGTGGVALYQASDNIPLEPVGKD